MPLYVPFDRFVAWKRSHPRRSIFYFFCEVMAGLSRTCADQFHAFATDSQHLCDGTQGLFRILLDGPNELHSASREALSATLEQLQPLYPTILAIRPSDRYGTLPQWQRYHISPLVPSGMRALLHDCLAPRDRKGVLEDLLCDHLDEVADLTELVGNPFYLALVCASASTQSPKSHSPRTPLFRSLVDMVADCCHHNHVTAGYPFTPAIRKLSEEVAYGLLSRENDSPYQFDESEVATLAQDSGQLASTWWQANLTKLVNECSGMYAFVHPSVHDYLAAQAMTRHLRNETLSIDAIGLNPKWFSSLRFVFGNLRHTEVPSGSSQLDCDALPNG